MSEANKKYVTIGVVGMIPEIRVNGPLKTPHYIDIEMVKAMVLHGRRVYEHNPAKPSERVLLTIENMDKDNFGKYGEDVKVYTIGKDAEKEPEKTPAVESVPETPVAPVVNEDPAPQEPEAPVDPEPAVENAPADEPKTVVDPVPETPVVETTQNSNKNQNYNGKKNNKKK